MWYTLWHCSDIQLYFLNLGRIFFTFLKGCGELGSSADLDIYAFLETNPHKYSAGKISQLYLDWFSRYYHLNCGPESRCSRVASTQPYCPRLYLSDGSSYIGLKCCTCSLNMLMYLYAKNSRILWDAEVGVFLNFGCLHVEWPTFLAHFMTM